MTGGSVPRVLQIGKFYPPSMGGMETHLHALCGELKRHFTVNVLVANRGHCFRQEIVEGVAVTRLGRLFSVKSTPICPRIIREIRDTSADLIHIHLPNPVAVVAYLLSGRRGRLVVTWHSDVVRQRILADVLAPIHNRLLEGCSVCIATSPNYLEGSAMLRRHRARSRVIPYGIALERFSSVDLAPSAAIRERYPGPLVLAVGRLVYYKGFEYLLRAMCHVRATLLIVGEGPLRLKLESDARALGIADRVFLLGEIQNENTTPYYQAADVFVLPSIARSEAFGIVQLEAMACSRPVVNTFLDSGVPFVSLDGLTGFTVPPRDSVSLAAAINRLLGDPEMCARYGAEGARRVRAEFTVSRMADRVMEVYEEALQSSTGSGPIGQIPLGS